MTKEPIEFPISSRMAKTAEDRERLKLATLQMLQIFHAVASNLSAPTREWFFDQVRRTSTEWTSSDRTAQRWHQVVFEVLESRFPAGDRP